MTVWVETLERVTMSEEGVKQICCSYRMENCRENQPTNQCLSQDLEIGCPKLAIVKFWGS